ncbi:MAG: hypothetical protein VXZ82_05300 [Planctomycetota bacterium]|nr:hypothetical protein [Planctomycetota bacterium]
MAKDLEKFLQQAAERLAEKVKKGLNTPPPKRNTQQPSQARPPKNVRRAERAPIEAEVIEAELIDADLAGPDPISDIDTRHLDPAVSHRPELAQRISQADERMSSHIHDVMDHEIVKIRKASNALDGKAPAKKAMGNAIVEMLRSPNSIQQAFIASQIFQRKFE